VHYRNAKPTAGALIVREGKVLLGRRAVEPFLGWWDIPGGFLDPWEHPADGVVREVREETGLIVLPGELLSVIVDTYGDGGDYTLNFYYLAANVAGEPRPADDVAELGWFAPEALPEQVAFASGRQALATWQRRLRGEGGR
jgi:ADP-ribose pyrophosphatase YjhB (NUDIX family)